MINMKTLVKARRAPGLEMQHLPIPTYDNLEVLVKIHKTAICGTDIHIYAWDQWAQATIPTPMTIGHEFYGGVVAVGSEVDNALIGKRVSGEGHIICGQCRNCRAGKLHFCKNTLGVGVNRPGCFAEYLSIPASNIVVLPDVITDDQAAILDPLGNATHCALAFDMVGEDILITGAGPIGVMAVAIARHVGARHVVITDVNDYRLDLAREMGATRAVNVSRESLESTVSDLGMTDGFKVGLEMSGHPHAFNDMIAQMQHGGQIALLGIPPDKTAIDWNLVIFKSLIIKGIYGREMFETWYKMMAMLESGLKIEPIITHHFPVDDFEEAFKLAASGRSGKVLLTW